MTILAIDTSASLCAAGVFDGERELGREVIDIGKGHAEHLMAVIDAALERADQTYADLTRIVVAIGPGSFTGIRVGVAAARGLALALKIPAVGVSNLEAVAAEVAAAFPGRNVMAAFISAQAMQLGIYQSLATIVHDPVTMTPEATLSLAQRHNAVLAGSGAAVLAAIDASLETASTAVTADLAVYARLGLTKDTARRPAPLYMREPDAKPQAGFVLPRA